MNNIEKLFEVEEICTEAGTKANLVIVESQGKGPAYLGFCEALEPCLDGNVQELAGGGMLVLTGASLAIIYHNGSPVTAPKNWKELVIKSVHVQDPIVIVIEDTSSYVFEDGLTLVEQTA